MNRIIFDDFDNVFDVKEDNTDSNLDYLEIKNSLIETDTTPFEDTNNGDEFTKELLKTFLSSNLNKGKEKIIVFDDIKKLLCKKANTKNDLIKDNVKKSLLRLSDNCIITIISFLDLKDKMFNFINSCRRIYNLFYSDSTMYFRKIHLLIESYFKTKSFQASQKCIEKLKEFSSINLSENRYVVLNHCYCEWFENNGKACVFKKNKELLKNEYPLKFQCTNLINNHEKSTFMKENDELFKVINQKTDKNNFCDSILKMIHQLSEELNKNTNDNDKDSIRYNQTNLEISKLSHSQFYPIEKYREIHLSHFFHWLDAREFTSVENILNYLYKTDLFGEMIEKEWKLKENQEKFISISCSKLEDIENNNNEIESSFIILRMLFEKILNSNTEMNLICYIFIGIIFLSSNFNQSVAGIEENIAYFCYKIIKIGVISRINLIELLYFIILTLRYSNNGIGCINYSSIRLLNDICYRLENPFLFSAKIPINNKSDIINKEKKDEEEYAVEEDDEDNQNPLISEIKERIEAEKKKVIEEIEKFKKEAREKNFVLSEEQERIVKQKIEPGQILRVNAYAGTGKTETCRWYVAERPHLKFLYLVFNKKMAEEASKKFPSNVECKTIHALAHEVTNMNNFKHKFVDNEYYFKIRESDYKFIKEKTGIKDNDAFPIIMETLLNFFKSVHWGIKLEHIPQKYIPYFKHDIKKLRNFLEWEPNSGFDVVPDFIKDLLQGKETKPEKPNFDMNAEELKNLSFSMVELFNWTDQVFNLMQDPTSPVPLTHESYLKLYQLSCPEWSKIYDIVMVDEAQDIAGSAISIINNQKKTPVILIGDKHQQIYAFRGAINSMDGMKKKIIEYELTKSYRFDYSIASIANAILYNGKDEMRPLIGNGQKRKINDSLYRNYLLNSSTESSSSSSSSIPSDPSLDNKIKKEYGGMVTEDYLINNCLPITIVSRTNACLFEKSLEVLDKLNEKGISNGKIVFNGGLKTYNKEIILSIYALYKGDYKNVKDPKIKWCLDKKDPFIYFSNYCKGKADRQEYRVAISLVNKFKDQLLLKMNKLEESTIEIENVTDYESIKNNKIVLICSTVHKAKGLEWDYVLLTDDFKIWDEKEGLREKILGYLKNQHTHYCLSTSKANNNINNINNNNNNNNAFGFKMIFQLQEINHVYVAVTRSKRFISLPKIIRALIKMNIKWFSFPKTYLDFLKTGEDQNISNNNNNNDNLKLRKELCIMNKNSKYTKTNMELEINSIKRISSYKKNKPSNQEIIIFNKTGTLSDEIRMTSSNIKVSIINRIEESSLQSSSNFIESKGIYNKPLTFSFFENIPFLFPNFIIEENQKLNSFTSIANPNTQIKTTKRDIIYDKHYPHSEEKKIDGNIFWLYDLYHNSLNNTIKENKTPIKFIDLSLLGIKLSLDSYINLIGDLTNTTTNNDLIDMEHVTDKGQIKISTHDIKTPEELNKSSVHKRKLGEFNSTLTETEKKISLPFFFKLSKFF
jgi:hypothetical protein